MSSKLALPSRVAREKVLAFLLTGLALVLATASALALYRTSLEARNLRAISKAENASKPFVALPPIGLERTEGSDFSSALPAAIDSQPIVAEVQRAASAAAATFGGAQIQSRDPVAGQLARTEFVLSLRGSYSSSKHVAAELLNRFPNATMVRLSLRKNVVPADLDATMVLALWGAASRSDARGSRSEAGS